MLIGYARCSTDAQDVAAQRIRLAELGVPTDRIYVDHGFTGTEATKRTGLHQALAACRAGDTFTITKMDRFARSIVDAHSIADQIQARDALLSINGTVYDPTDPMGRLFFSILAVFAEFEVALIRQRTREGMAIARAKGRLRGKQPKLKPVTERHLVETYRAGRHTTGELAEMFGIARSTVYRAIRRHEEPETDASSAERTLSDSEPSMGREDRIDVEE